MMIAGAALLITMVIILQLVFLARGAPAASQFPITVAIIALIGTLWTGAITLAGLMLKDSVDRRSALLQAESEKRLRMETALKAVELISKAEIDGASVQESREAAIMVISSLNQNRLALGLGEQFWNRKKISTEAFVEIVDQCLRTDDDSLKEQGCGALAKYHRKLVLDSTTIIFPHMYCFNWDGRLSFNAKNDLLSAMIQAMLSKEYDFWNINAINGVVYCLYKMFMNDSDPRFKCASATLAVSICNLWEPFPGYCLMPTDRQKISYDEIRDSANGVMQALGDPDEFLYHEIYEFTDKIRTWKYRKLDDDCLDVEPPEHADV